MLNRKEQYWSSAYLFIFIDSLTDSSVNRQNTPLPPTQKNIEWRFKYLAVDYFMFQRFSDLPRKKEYEIFFWLSFFFFSCEWKILFLLKVHCKNSSKHQQSLFHICSGQNHLTLISSVCNFFKYGLIQRILDDLVKLCNRTSDLLHYSSEEKRHSCLLERVSALSQCKWFKSFQGNLCITQI